MQQLVEWVGVPLDVVGEESAEHDRAPGKKATDHSHRPTAILPPANRFPLATVAGFWYFPAVNESAFRAVISGERRGLTSGGIRGILSLLSLPYQSVVGLRNRAYDRGWLREHSVSVPVLSVGNLTVGGTGKTPLVAWLTDHLRNRGHAVGLLSRGYGGDEHGNDEKRLLEQLCADVPHIQDPDRVSAARRIATDHDCSVLVLDDGFQHRRLRRDLDIVLIDSTCPFGFGHLLPRGYLREPADELSRASFVVITRVERVGPQTRRSLRERVIELAAHDRVAEVTFQASRLVNSREETTSLDLLARSRTAAFCGIGNPGAFFASLATVATRTFPDHHRYESSDLDQLEEWATRSAADVLVTTRKDLVKIPRTHLGRIPLWAIEIDVDFVSGRQALEAAVAAATLDDQGLPGS